MGADSRPFRLPRAGDREEAGVQDVDRLLPLLIVGRARFGQIDPRHCATSEPYDADSHQLPRRKAATRADRFGHFSDIRFARTLDGASSEVERSPKAECLQDAQAKETAPLHRDRRKSASSFRTPTSGRRKRNKVWLRGERKDLAPLSSPSKCSPPNLTAASSSPSRRSRIHHPTTRMSRSKFRLASRNTWDLTANDPG